MATDILKTFLFCILINMTLNLSAQTPDTIVLWPQGVKESNGISTPETVNQRGNIANISKPELYVYHPAKEKNTGMAVIICPGGGYTNLAMNHEGYMFAKWLTGRGITAVILKYRMPNAHPKIPLADASRAVRLVRSRAEDWEIKTDKIGVAGFSAGGHLASTIGTRFDTGKPESGDRLEHYSSRPDFLILFYPVISMEQGLTHQGSRNSLLGKNPTQALVNQYSNDKHVTAKTPPAFIVHSDDDKGVSSLNSIAFYRALKNNNVPAVMYIFDKGGHGWGLRDTFQYYPQWTKLLDTWLKHQK